MVECSLLMQKARDSIPCTSIVICFKILIFKTWILILVLVLDCCFVLEDTPPSIYGTIHEPDILC